jgi:DNA-directed RNA polymerase subunit RPC12/RpoP
VFHFQELDWFFYFPSNEGNRGKYCGYTVLLKERKKSGADRRVNLGDTVERREFEEHYPHTVGFFKGSGEKREDYRPQYMELRIIHNIDEFWLFLNALNL